MGKDNGQIWGCSKIHNTYHTNREVLDSIVNLILNMETCFEALVRFRFTTL